ncbi:di-trans,poly-cis-decaprenylcistransferase [Vibrio cincinnatiensis]|jgi:undecaprenyl diphosphate synthase|uniref:Ditrans,polycis-undecaprenyl-diphosphate synthase ((2E,6E)-farnesyl-diphosphate specific) n=1 Tax=Vibrio cincinnatiensis DSM 19608 TaxID=1123491 RepID=A0A1T4MQ50_VIBCI|nr:polyprenyl diphosphate synthase [Vibrio cincinnatiensis]MCG3722744.1 di-trans,poly-cis-decaprenylcistransferase [Vibrio cincinnatiensis]MCG3726110.1 di-trans,poly-cis-decaprenylcistransferase [Vibrio cincinnatiensis]MCG3732634.1 di-trans,poly-cis-decaprenylcistransferase [Vibrio cincinnatiensis]MCG3736159.1 di-trans,poly-cis-decaprenylcistransferase [Vibrio cincinnatiensis]MCG3738631.1 di-trans,poly-cis-decaprenylcistransferase [Vibrio cincinnatiensis]
MQKSPLSSDVLPKHIAIIMDGNGRWAKAQGKPRVFGHKNGVSAVRKTISTSAKLGIKAVTLFAFSSENWRRPEEEVGVLMELFISVLSTEVKKLHKNNLRLRIIGDKSRFSERLQSKIAQAEALTQDNTGMVINIAANYGGKWDITQAVRDIAAQVSRGDLLLEEIDEAVVASHLTMADLPEVDLLIRTSGECRISNFMLWQLAYAEMYFTPVFWPEFGEESLIEAVTWFVNRERRFGCTGEQIKALMTS